MIDVPWVSGIFGDGNAGRKIIEEIVSYLNCIAIKKV